MAGPLPFALQGLQQAVPPMQDARNRNLNSAFQSQAVNSPGAFFNPTAAAVPQGDTNFDPLMGTGWDKWLDQVGASDPGGAHIGNIPQLRSDPPGSHGIATDPRSSFNTNPNVPHVNPAVQGLMSSGLARLRGKMQTQGGNPNAVTPGVVE